MILLDTHVLVWLAFDPGKISKAASSAIRRARRDGGLAASAISLWEIAWMATHGRLTTTGTLEAYLDETVQRVNILPISSKVSALANQLPADYPNDPCDRLIGGTALSEGLVLVTKDERIRACAKLQTLW